ncbi:DUF2235 domain-containing protein [Enterovirga sp. DB1703]|uniref:DUF2235 domain-containing protein n=2 Tax=Enterovirga aerilata TaxID=2730920 RepID=A0A849I429_9HYPH|nr:DUF2235 domain-containing protein [Enterovirga sp. DB1703]NNM72091.1 DUF2235 domain-containing protein [Enterovirga sp. DB1703]
MKRLAIFLDGTWNTLNNNTNVWRLKSLCDPNAPDQMVYYGQGVGTRLGEKARGGIGGYGLDNEILDGYTWLAEVFEPGDEIFIFGFSRGAYAARSLSGLISKCGVLRPGAPLSVEQLYERYRRDAEPTIRALKAGPADASRTLEERWLLSHCEITDIKFVGVWDTVGSLGNPLGRMHRKVAKYKFLDTHLRLSNQHAFHAVALDEHREPFEPTFWTRTVDNAKPDGGARPRTLAEVEQRWFVGAHANVGGGYPSDILAQAPLKWLMDKAALHGLRFRPGFQMDPVDPAAPITDSYSEFGNPLLRAFSKRFYRPVGPPPQVGATKTTARINETIDGSVFDRWRENPAYRPANLGQWAERKGVDPAMLVGARLASDPSVIVGEDLATPATA